MCVLIEWRQPEGGAGGRCVSSHSVVLVSVRLKSPQRSAQFVVVHVRFAFPLPPESGQPLGVPDDKLAPLPSPADGSALAPSQQLQQEVPQLDLPGAWRPGRLVGPVWEQNGCRERNGATTVCVR